MNIENSAFEFEVCERSGQALWECGLAACENGCPTKTVEVVPVEQLRGAVGALRKIDALLDADTPSGPFRVRVEEITADALALYGGQSGASRGTGADTVIPLNLLGSEWLDEHGNRYRVRGVHYTEDPELSLECIPPTGKRATLSALVQSHRAIKDGDPVQGLAYYAVGASDASPSSQPTTSPEDES